MHRHTRSTLLAGLLALAASLAIAACGSSTSSSASASASASASSGSATTSTGSTTTARAGAGHFTSLTSTQRSCLKSHGVTFPTGAGGGQPGAGTRTTGSFTPPSGGTSTRPTGTPPSGGGSRGFGGAATSSKDAAAFKACGVTTGTGSFGAGAPSGGPSGSTGAATPTAAALKTFEACVDKHGYTLTASEVNSSGKGSILPASLKSNAKFLAAAKDCEQDLTSASSSSS